MTELEITSSEIILMLLASGVLYAVLAMVNRRPLRNAFLVLCIVPALFLAVEGTVELLTTDETYMITEITGLKQVSFRQWSLANYHTSIATIGNVVSLAGRLFLLNDLQLKILAKSIHWLLGFLILVGIWWTSRRWVPKNLETEYFLIYFYSTLLLPTNILALKVANYDMFAMLLGVWGLICGLVAVENVKQTDSPQAAISKAGPPWRAFLFEILTPDGGFALLAVVLATLAAQEKQIAAPFLNLALILSVYMRLRRRGGIDWWLPVQIGISVFAVLLILLLSYGMVAIWQPPGLPHLNLVAAWTSLFPHFDFVARAVGTAQSHSLIESAFGPITIAVVPILIWWLRNIATEKIEFIVRSAFPFLFIVVVALGAIAYYRVEAFLHPNYPIPSGNFVPEAEMNGEIVHYLGHTHLEHLVRKIGRSHTTFALTVPSVFLLIALLTLIKRRRLLKPELALGLYAVGVLSLAMPIVYVMTNIPLGIRYINIWIFFDVLLLAIVGCRLLEFVPNQKLRALAIAVFCLLLTLEVVPFGPLFATFRPWWASAAGLQVERGKAKPVWTGWGEETMIAGRWLRQKARSGQLPSKSFRVFALCRSDWLQSDPAIVTYSIGAAPYLSFTENDYYIINRGAVMLGAFVMPTDKKPIWTLEYRGAPQAWVFRGIDLQNPPSSDTIPRK